MQINKHKYSGKLALPILAIMLWLFSVGSAMGVVYSTYESRKATQKLEELRREASGLRVMSGKFLLEKSSWAAYSRVEKIAFDELNMFVPENEKTILVYKK
ncbi:cell division protein FtsL [Agarilytica rhodophyticola]|uniref:cell division protein FtsL n=1 Tax=Agarilytica rhodophyticola TaxID=1737490 RepID=UPI001FE5E3A9|nr:cell division protein FtsL [Agarilytica rhodophyticola]